MVSFWIDDKLRRRFHLVGFAKPGILVSSNSFPHFLRPLFRTERSICLYITTYDGPSSTDLVNILRSPNSFLRFSGPGSMTSSMNLTCGLDNILLPAIHSPLPLTYFLVVRSSFPLTCYQEHRRYLALTHHTTEIDRVPSTLAIFKLGVDRRFVKGL